MGNSVRAKRRLKNVAIMRQKLQVYNDNILNQTVDRMNAHLASQETNVQDLTLPPEMNPLTIDKSTEEEQDSMMEDTTTKNNEKKLKVKKKQNFNKKKTSKKSKSKRKPRIV